MSQRQSLLTIISGGQTGADIGALKAAHDLNIKTDGYAPKNYHTENGSNFDLKNIYKLKEVQSLGYKEKEILNVDLCDALIAFRIKKEKTGKGTETVINYARTKEYKHIPLQYNESTEIILFEDGNKPVIVIWDLTDENIDLYAKYITDFLLKYKAKKIMISGPCESTYNIEKNIILLFKNVLSSLKY